jgi:hypothetical protein
MLLGYALGLRVGEMGLFGSEALANNSGTPLLPPTKAMRTCSPHPRRLVCVQAALLLSIMCLHAASTARAQGEHREAFVQQTTRAANASFSSGPALSRSDAKHLIIERLDLRGQAQLNAYFARADEVAGHFAWIAQQHVGNQAMLEQFGTAHLAVVEQQGVGNTTHLRQFGSDHLYGSWLRGDGNAVEVVQEGRSNHYLLEFEGDGLQHTALQAGVNLQAVQVGVTSVPFSIEQRGSDMSLLIRHNGAVDQP